MLPQIISEKTLPQFTMACPISFADARTETVNAKNAPKS
ncbi:conserved hypothetical protein [delta proteobacterium NaphS2]|nr:conserved hypothetical protein [delta proteobacterium NaphS2]